MCAINPVHKKRLVFDVYTSDSRLAKEDFETAIIALALKAELTLNTETSFRWHLKETEQEAE